MIASPSQVPAALVDEVVVDMSVRMAGGPEARRCSGLSFAFEITDRPVRVARYAVGEDGAVSLTRVATEPATFHFKSDARTLDETLLGRSSAIGAIVARRIAMRGSMFRIRGILRMMPAVNRAYAEARQAMMQRHAGRYDFRI